MNEEKYRKTAGMVLNELDRRLRKLSKPLPDRPIEFFRQMKRIERICYNMEMAILATDDIDDEDMDDEARNAYESVEELIKDMKQDELYKES